jgi:arginase
MMNTLLKIIKNRSDIGAGTRGSDLGIDALEIAAINADSDFFNRHPFVDVETHNETIYNKVQNSTAKRIHFVAAQCERLKKSIVSTMQSDFFPLCSLEIILLHLAPWRVSNLWHPQNN